MQLSSAFDDASPSEHVRAAWAVATVEARRRDDFNAARRENLAWRQMYKAGRRKSGQYLMSLPASLDGIGMGSCLEDLLPVQQEKRRLPALIQRASRRTTPATVGAFWPVAAASIAVNSLSMAPYNAFLVMDPGGPLFFNFAVHLVIIILYLPKTIVFIRRPRIPIRYHMAMVTFWCLFVTLRSDAFARLSPAVCVLVSNMRMVLGMLVQFLFSGRLYSSSQVLGVIIITVGIATAGHSMQQAGVAQSQPGSSGMISFVVGVLEVLVSALSYALYTSVLKVAFARFGESIDEQVFVTHLCALLFLFPSQWEKVGPRLAMHATEPDPWLLSMLAAGVLLNVASRWIFTQLAGRAPNLLMAQLVSTVEGFLQLLMAALLRVPPWPPRGFWVGSLALVLGTVQYLRASGEPEEDAGAESADEVPRAETSGAAWAIATVEAKQGCPDAARRENLAWRKAHLVESGKL